MSVHTATPEDSAEVPSTPPPGRDRPSQSSDANNERQSYASPPALSSSLTPPPSTQPARFFPSDARSSSKLVDSVPDSPPTTVRVNAMHTLPTAEKIASAGLDELRAIAHDLVSSLVEARMSTAHFKLQYTLLAMETQEAAQRAEVEHQMTRREIEVLHAVEQRHRATAHTPRSLTQPLAQPQIAALTKTCRDLEEERDEIEDRFQEVKKLLDLEKDRAELLTEENVLLKKRIRENREHFTKLKDSPAYSTPRHTFTTPRRKSYSRFPDDTPAHEPFAALLYADQMLSQETASVPSTPTPTRLHTTRLKQGHTRGAHSLSSLHTTPVRRPMTSDGHGDPRSLASAPGSRLVNNSAERDRHDRDSTISISDVEDGSGDDVLQSQASSLATDMLRKNPTSQESIRQSQEAERSSNLLQTKLFGNIKKPGLTKSKNKRSLGQDFDDQIRGKKSKLDKTAGFGVGIGRGNRASS